MSYILVVFLSIVWILGFGYLASHVDFIKQNKAFILLIIQMLILLISIYYLKFKH